MLEAIKKLLVFSCYKISNYFESASLKWVFYAGSLCGQPANLNSESPNNILKLEKGKQAPKAWYND